MNSNADTCTSLRLDLEKKTWQGQWNSFRNYQILFLIEDTSELECWTLVKCPKRHSNVSPGESLTARRKVRICWLSSGLIDFPQGSWWLSLGVTKDELECLQGIWDRNCIPRSPQNDSSPPYRKLENGRNQQSSCRTPVLQPSSNSTVPEAWITAPATDARSSWWILCPWI